MVRGGRGWGVVMVRGGRGWGVLENERNKWISTVGYEVE